MAKMICALKPTRSPRPMLAKFWSGLRQEASAALTCTTCRTVASEQSACASRSFLGTKHQAGYWLQVRA
ncbi:UNVERIFIED_CONTAM: hypothetical protein GTU68_060538 [Idotea baltica]|nr:hypothetical protein [Idotea baltica]